MEEYTHRLEERKEFERIPTYLELSFQISVMALTKSGQELNVYYNLKSAAQGGPIKVTGLHFAAMHGDIQLCRLLLCRGAHVNANIFIPNDQESSDLSQEAANRADGLFEGAGGKPGGTAVATLEHQTIGSSFAIRGNPGFPSMPRSSCWTNANGDEIMYLNTYMHGERVYASLLFKRGVDPVNEKALDDIASEAKMANIRRDLGLSR
ncbi:expressed unknown protein [Seminavis robusta]|uniref:Uncharacterized protein n=1 Tax=Seminavis robusta TaxID=568900 RepID=A0A9N8HUC7_9STRA|nr:expressed unknown protein [Seminavis robusta]|eukprot:Sro1367_g266720.1 n/a (208) ;mRNA; f:12589-13297